MNMRPAFNQCASTGVCPPPPPNHTINHHPPNVDPYYHQPPPPHPQSHHQHPHGIPPHGHPHQQPLPPPPHPHCQPYGMNHNPYYPSPCYRIHELNKKLQQQTPDCDNRWWDAFANEFFDDDATISISVCLENGFKRYSIGRTSVPRFFRTLFNGGVEDLSFHIRHAKESFHQSSIILDCEDCLIITQYSSCTAASKGMNANYNMDEQPTKDQNSRYDSIVINTEGSLLLEFRFIECSSHPMRIKSWHFKARNHQEYVPRNLIVNQAQQDPMKLEEMSKNVTRQGISNDTINFLQLCVIMETMQELMSRHKDYALSPRDCLNRTLYHKWQKMCPPQKNQRVAPKRNRKRKPPANSTTNGGSGGGRKKANASASPGPPNFLLSSQDVMVVGEPTLMGGEFGDEDERIISRLENSQCDLSNLSSCGAGGGQPSHNQPPGPPHAFIKEEDVFAFESQTNGFSAMSSSGSMMNNTNNNTNNSTNNSNANMKNSSVGPGSRAENRRNNGFNNDLQSPQEDKKPFL